jgi:exopolysaccharide biosynthesis predicted pyruvyltransferase EpsI
MIRAKRKQESSASDMFESFLVQNKNKKMYVITPGGNNGDTLIHMGLIKKLNQIGADYVSINLDEMSRNQIIFGLKYLLDIAAFKIGIDRNFNLFNIPKETELILFGGGGYMNDLYYGFVLLKQILKNKKIPVAVAPNSYLFKKTDLKALFATNRSYTFFCREKYSFELFSEMNLSKDINVHLSNDTSLYLKRNDFKKFVSPSKSEHTLICFRMDKESTIPKNTKKKIVENAKINSNNLLIKDIAKIGSFEDYISAVFNADEVYTDRIHVAILAHICKKKTSLFGNCYHKNKGVYEFSLKNNSKIKFQ